MTKLDRILICCLFFVIGLSVGYSIQEQRKDDLKTKETSIVQKISDLEEENEILRDELQMKESEISYWGRQYDSLKTEIKYDNK